MEFFNSRTKLANYNYDNTVITTPKFSGLKKQNKKIIYLNRNTFFFFFLWDAMVDGVALHMFTYLFIFLRLLYVPHILLGLVGRKRHCLLPVRAEAQG